RHRVQQSAERLTSGPSYIDSGLFFVNADGSPIHPVLFSQSFDAHVRRLGLKRIRLHDLRHTYATLALQAGIHPKVVSERLGHANISITIDTYSHVAPSMHAEAANTVAALFLQ